MQTAFLLIGGNMGNRVQLLEKAILLITEQCGTVVNRSAIYETAAWGNEAQPAFLNQVLQITTLLSARKLMRQILRIEIQMGRIRQKKYGPRSIDIDILLFNGEVHFQQNLKVPHPQMQHRRFALLPLTEIAPKIIHPLLNLTVSTLLVKCKDSLAVKKYS